MTDVRAFTVGPIQENAYLVRRDETAAEAVLVDPGEEPQRLLEAVERLGVRVTAILITHCHFDHIGAVAPVARVTEAPVYCPEIEVGILADITKWTMSGFGPYESWRADHTLAGGERLRLAGLDVEVLFTPGHSPGHLSYAIAPAGGQASAAAGEEAPRSIEHAGGTTEGSSPAVLLSGDVLFQGSVGRTDFPGSDWPTLERSIGALMERFPGETVVYPGHMGATTLGREWAVNPFLAELRAGAASG
jgi:glyoxylase-like metal-dependent hydrolase (beta-lactamase superfamily II)